MTETYHMEVRLTTPKEQSHGGTIGNPSTTIKERRVSYEQTQQCNRIDSTT